MSGWPTNKHIWWTHIFIQKWLNRLIASHSRRNSMIVGPHRTLQSHMKNMVETHTELLSQWFSELQTLPITPTVRWPVNKTWHTSVDVQKDVLLLLNFILNKNKTSESVLWNVNTMCRPGHSRVCTLSAERAVSDFPSCSTHPNVPMCECSPSPCYFPLWSKTVRPLFSSVVKNS